MKKMGSALSISKGTIFLFCFLCVHFVLTAYIENGITEATVWDAKKELPKEEYDRLVEQSGNSWTSFDEDRRNEEIRKQLELAKNKLDVDKANQLLTFKVFLAVIFSIALTIAMASSDKYLLQASMTVAYIIIGFATVLRAIDIISALVALITAGLIVFFRRSGPRQADR